MADAQNPFSRLDGSRLKGSVFAMVAQEARTTLQELRRRRDRNMWDSTEHRRCMAISAIHLASNDSRVGSEIVMWVRALSREEADALLQDFADRQVKLRDATHELKLKMSGNDSTDRSS